ncbi:MAG: DUF167 domain-containing protein [Spirobacillus cienkowskii]|jgi:uncharacterized protein (TIGR00251 family)|uniref:UPF0235 protein DCC88_12270 n=1 Tax=Spirobacillus cienkowskii TaxID=495820 RepID=A0A369KK85_9BACT|nr:MAG: DUF167 domain-containing protein [Spirobacillus cienkowskii]
MTIPTTIKIKVTTRAKTEKIKQEVLPDNSIFLRVYVTAPPEDGKANDAVIKLIAKSFGVSKSSVSIIKGQTSREKVLEIK